MTTLLRYLAARSEVIEAIVGAALLVAGVACISTPAAMVLAGVLIIANAVLDPWTRRRG